MTDEIALSRAAARAAQAQSLLDNELLKEALETLEATYIKAWRYSNVDDDKVRERLWQAVQIVGKVRDHLSIVVSHGKLADRELAEMAGKHGRFKE